MSHTTEGKRGRRKARRAAGIFAGAVAATTGVFAIAHAGADAPPDPEAASLGAARRGPEVVSASSEDLNLAGVPLEGRLAEMAEPDARSVTASLVGETQPEGVSYTLEILDSAADLQWIIESDGLERRRQGLFTGTLASASEIVGEIGEIKYAILLSAAFSPQRLLEIADSLQLDAEER